MSGTGKLRCQSTYETCDITRRISFPAINAPASSCRMPVPAKRSVLIRLLDEHSTTRFYYLLSVNDNSSLIKLLVIAIRIRMNYTCTSISQSTRRPGLHLHSTWSEGLNNLYFANILAKYQNTLTTFATQQHDTRLSFILLTTKT